MSKGFATILWWFFFFCILWIKAVNFVAKPFVFNKICWAKSSFFFLIPKMKWHYSQSTETKIKQRLGELDKKRILTAKSKEKGKSRDKLSAYRQQIRLSLNETARVKTTNSYGLRERRPSVYRRGSHREQDRRHIWENLNSRGAHPYPHLAGSHLLVDLFQFNPSPPSAFSES